MCPVGPRHYWFRQSDAVPYALALLTHLPEFSDPHSPATISLTRLNTMRTQNILRFNAITKKAGRCAVYLTVSALNCPILGKALVHKAYSSWGARREDGRPSA